MLDSCTADRVLRKVEQRDRVENRMEGPKRDRIRDEVAFRRSRYFVPRRRAWRGKRGRVVYDYLLSSDGGEKERSMYAEDAFSKDLVSEGVSTLPTGVCLPSPLPGKKAEVSSRVLYVSRRQNLLSLPLRHSQRCQWGENCTGEDADEDCEGRHGMDVVASNVESGAFVDFLEKKGIGFEKYQRVGELLFYGRTEDGAHVSRRALAFSVGAHVFLIGGEKEMEQAISLFEKREPGLWSRAAFAFAASLDYETGERTHRVELV